MSGPILKLAQDLVITLDQALVSAPHTDPTAPGRAHARALSAARDEAQLIVNLAGEAADIEQEHPRPDYQALLYELLDAVQLQGGRQGLATTNRAGVDSALAAVREMGPLLGKPPDDRGALLEAVRAQDATCTLHLFAAKAARFDVDPLEEHLDYPTPDGAAVVAGMVFLVPSPPPLRSMRRASVIEVVANGRCAIVRAKLDPPRSVRAVQAEAAN